MALLRIDHTSESARLNLPLYIILPDPGRMGDLPVRGRKVLYLLHGLSDDGSAWQRYTSIEYLAMAYGLVVVMPSVGRSFYTDLPNGQLYFTYLIEELPQYLSDVFDLNPARADTFIAGNSMGGYGAFKAAFHYPERFAAAASFSGVLSIDHLRVNPSDPRLAEFSFMFGDLSSLSGSSNDPMVWYRQAAQDPDSLPDLYISCGLQDDLYPISRAVHMLFQELGIKADYYEAPGGHNWFFWDAQIRRFLEAVLGPVPQI